MLVPTWTFGGYQSLKSNISFKTLLEGNNLHDNQLIANNNIDLSTFSYDHKALFQNLNDFTINDKKFKFRK